MSRSRSSHQSPGAPPRALFGKEVLLPGDGQLSPVPVGGGLVFDEEFKAKPENLGSSINYPPGLGCVWKRPRELGLGKATVFPETDNNDNSNDNSNDGDDDESRSTARARAGADAVRLGGVLQGNMCDEWLLGALGVMASRPALLKRLFTRNLPQRGLCHVCVHKFGEWIEVVVDDNLPVVGSGSSEDFVFGLGLVPAELWCPLLEKGYAKLHGSYASVEYGHPGDALSDLTGGISTSITWSLGERRTTEASGVNKSQYTLDRAGTLGPKIQWHLTRGDLVAAVADKPDIRGQPVCGVLPGHAYALTALVESPKHHLLVRLMTPWGGPQWDGACGNEDSAFWGSPEGQKICDGGGGGGKGKRGAAFDPRAELMACESGRVSSFHIPWDDFVRLFSELITVRLLGRGMRRVSLQGSWTRQFGTAGGCFSDERALSNPQFLVTVGGTEPADVILQTEQTDNRMSDVPAPEWEGHMFYVFSADKHLSHWKEPLARTACPELRQVNAELRLAPGKYVVLPCCQSGVEGIFRVEVIFPEGAEVTMAPLEPEQNSSALPGSLSKMLSQAKAPNRSETLTDAPHAFHRKRFPINLFARTMRAKARPHAPPISDQRGKALTAGTGDPGGRASVSGAHDAEHRNFEQEAAVKQARKLAPGQQKVATFMTTEADTNNSKGKQPGCFGRRKK